MDLVLAPTHLPKTEVRLARQLAPADLELLRTRTPRKPEPIRKLRERHHAVARLLAQGSGVGEVAAILGYERERITQLLQDPTFKELLEFYRRGVTERFYDLHEKLAALSHDAVAELHDRLESEPESLSTDQLMDVVKLTADRTGFGPQSRSVNVNVNVGLAARLEEARKRAGLTLVKEVEECQGS